MLSRNPLLIAASLLVAGLFPLAASAFFPPNPEYDLNNDGKISPQEIQTARTADFPLIDKNSNGYISFAEWQSWVDAQKTARFNTLDVDQNGSLSVAEFIASAPKKQDDGIGPRLFKLLDSNANSALSLAEFKVIGGLDRLIFEFAHLDIDSDNQISKAEYLAVPAQGPQGGPRPGR